MVQPIGFADYAAALGLPHPEAERAILDGELITIALYSRHIGCSAPGPRAAV